jgi:hypothetical protein
MIYHIFVLANFVILSLLVGGLFFVNMAVAPTFLVLSTGRYAEFHHVLDKYSDPLMPILTFGTALLAVPELFFAQPTWQMISRSCGIACILGVALTSILVHGPVNRRIRTWEPGKQIGELERMRKAWVSGHRFRTALALVGLLALFLPVVFSF